MYITQTSCRRQTFQESSDAGYLSTYGSDGVVMGQRLQNLDATMERIVSATAAEGSRSHSNHAKGNFARSPYFFSFTLHKTEVSFKKCFVLFIDLLLEPFPLRFQINLGQAAQALRYHALNSSRCT